jgi:hypothetical protein
MQGEEDTHDICHARIPRNFTSALSAPRLYFPVQADAPEEWVAFLDVR